MRLIQQPVVPHHLFGVTAFAFSYSVFEVLARHVPFFVAHDADLAALVAVGLGLGWFVPGLVGLLSYLVWKAAPRTGAVLSHGLLVAAVGAAVFRDAVGTGLPIAVVGAAGLVCGIVVDACYVKLKSARFALTVLAAIGVCYGPGFVVWMSRLVVPASPPPVSIELLPEDRPPVIFLVLDEMSTLALLNPDRSLDAEHFPSFARLADDGIWFRNGTSASDYTDNAIIAAVTGLYPERAPAQSTYNAYPLNVCTILDAAGYRVRARESVTHFCPDKANESLPARLPLGQRVRPLLADVTYILPHVYLSADLANQLAPINDRWRNFGGDDSQAGHHRAESFQEFIAELEPDPGVLYFAHFMFPHIPYEHLSSGEQYRAALTGSQRLRGNSGYHFHSYMQQAMYVDRLLGQLLNRLDSFGIYDHSAIVVVADHGVRYRDGYSRRDLSPDELRPADNDILKVPMFFKPPNLRGGQVIDAPVLAADLLPTLLAELGIVLSDSLDGRPAMTGQARSSLRYLDSSGAVLDHDADVLDTRYDVEWKQREFDAGRGFAPRSPFDDVLLGRTVSGLDGPGAAESYVVRLRESADFAVYEGRYVSGTGSATVPWIALTRDEVVVAVTRPEGDPVEGSFFGVLTPDGATDFFDPRHGSIEVFEIVPDMPELGLRPLEIRAGPEGH